MTDYLAMLLAFIMPPIMYLIVVGVHTKIMKKKEKRNEK